MLLCFPAEEDGKQAEIDLPLQFVLSNEEESLILVKQLLVSSMHEVHSY